MQSAARWLEDTFQYVFNTSALLDNALTHRSAPGGSNERLEFLGDAILDLVISAELYERCPDATEGDLSRLRAHLVNDASLARIASGLQLGEYLRLGDGERKSGGHRRSSILADALEALFAAIYLDGGYTAARDVILACFGKQLTDLPDAVDLRDPKTRLQEWLQKRGRPLPEYALDDVSGKAHQQRFEVTCTLEDGKEPTRGEGTSRRRAEQAAARRMLALLADGDST
jgi:ribonuclease-3